MRFPGIIGLPVADNFQVAIGREDSPVRVRSKIEDNKGWCRHFAIRVARVPFSGEVWDQSDPMIQIPRELNPSEADVSFVARWIEPNNGAEWIIATIHPHRSYELAAIVKGILIQSSMIMKYNQTSFRCHKHNPYGLDSCDRWKVLDDEFCSLPRSESALVGVFLV